MKRYIVIRQFADKDNIAKRYNPGDKLPETFSEERIANIVKLGLAKPVDETDPAEAEKKAAEKAAKEAAKKAAEAEKKAKKEE